MLIVHAADIHLDSPLAGLAARAGGRADELVGATRRAFTALVDHTIASDAALLLIAGDLYDGDWRDFSTGLFFVAEMARLERAGIRVAVIKGNHDAENLMTRSLSWPKNVKVFRADRPETWRLDDLGVAVHGQSFPQREVTENIALGYPDPVPGCLNIGLLHTAADGRPGHAPYAPCSLADLVARGYDYWALGHVHTRAVLHRDPWIVFPGNLQGRHANEPGAKGATTISVEAGEIVAVEPVALDVVRWLPLRVDLTGCGDHDDALDRIRTGLAGALADADGRTLAVRLILAGSAPVHRLIAGDLERTNAECAGLVEQADGEIWLERVVVETREPDATPRGDGDAMGELLRTVDSIRANPDEMRALRAELEQALGRMPVRVREQGGLKEIDDATLEAILQGATAALRHRLLDAD